MNARISILILVENGPPILGVGIQQDDHEKILALAESLHSQSIVKISDFFQHVRFEIDELPKLLEEISAMIANNSDAHLAHLLDEMRKNVVLAMEHKSPLLALAP